MTDPGLTNRLRQHSRRAGLAIGLSMALTIAVCLGGFVVIYAEVDPFLSDFIAAERATSTPEREREASQAAPETDEPEEEAAPTQPPQEEQQEQQQAPTPTPTAEAQPTATSELFEADYVMSAPESVNLRAGPGTEFEVVVVLTQQQPLQYLDESEESQNPGADGLSPGQQWLRFRTEANEEGWVREIDVEQSSSQ